jgi:hypothetical protein
MSNYIGIQPDTIYSALTVRYFYGLRRTDQGELFIGKVDQLSKTDSVFINNPGPDEENYPNLEEGVDFYEGRDVFHDTIYDNLKYEQFRWDNRNVYYYINSEGELVARINESYTYDETISSEGLE